MVLHISIKEKKIKKKEKNHKSITMVLHVCMKEKKIKKEEKNHKSFFIFISFIYTCSTIVIDL
jgi:hypothetical protein